eukprot:jgi/Orpsp1_1/1179872/evm.model.c7180000071137.1
MKSQINKNSKIIYYNFPTIDKIVKNKLPDSFFIFKSYFPIKNNNFNSKNINNKICFDSILDCGSY